MKNGSTGTVPMLPPSDRDFASGFLQIPRRRGHPCLRLVVPTTKPTADFHRQVIAHAGRT